MIVLGIGKGFGLPLPWEDETAARKAFHQAWQAIVELFLLYKLLCSVLAFRMYPSFEEFVYGIATELFQCFGFLLSLFYAVRRSSLERILYQMDSLSRDITASGLDMKEFYQETYTRDARNISRLARFLTPCSVICPLIFCISVPIMGLIDGSYGERLPVYNSCPFEISTPALYEYLIVQQFLGYLMPTLQKLGHECLMLGLFKIQSAYFKALAKGILHISNSDNLKSPQVTKQLKEWINLHQHVIRNANDLVNFFSPVIVLYYICIISVVAGGVFYQLNGESANAFQANFLGMYMGITMVYMYLQCHVGDELTNEASELANSVYNMPWYKSNSQVKGFIMLIINSANRPIIVMSFKSGTFRLSREAYQAFFTNTISAYMGFSKITGISE